MVVILGIAAVVAATSVVRVHTDIVDRSAAAAIVATVPTAIEAIALIVAVAITTEAVATTAATSPAQAAVVTARIAGIPATAQDLV